MIFLLTLKTLIWNERLLPTELEVVPCPGECRGGEGGGVDVAADLHRVPRVDLNQRLVLKEPRQR